MGGFQENPFVVDNPIIKAYVQGLQLRRQQEKQQADIIAQQEQTKVAQAHQKSYEQQIASEAELHKAQIDAERNRNILEAKKTLADMFSSGKLKTPQQTQNAVPTPVGGFGDYATGANQNPVMPQPTTGPAPVKVGSWEFNPQEFSTPQEQLANEMQRISTLAPVEAKAQGQIAGAKASAELPSELTKISAQGTEARKTSEQAQTAAQILEKQKAQETKDLQTIKDSEAFKRTQATVEGQKIAAGIRAQATIAAAKTRNEIDPEVSTNNAVLHATGQGGALLGNNKQDTATKLVMSHLGLTDMSPKMADDLKKVHSIDPLYQEMEGFISKLPDSTAEALAQGLAAHIPATDLANFKARILGVSGNISKNLGGETGRLTDLDIKRALGLLVQPGITKSQALERLRFFESSTRSKVMDQVLGGQTDKQKLLNLRTYDFDPAKFNGTTKYKNKDVQRFYQDPKDGEWLVFDPKKGGYVSTDATGK